MDYHGIASLFDARVVCMKPNFTNWKFAMGEKSARGNYVLCGFRGKLSSPRNILKASMKYYR